MDVLNSFIRKSEALNRDSLQPIVKRLQNSIYSILLRSTDPRSVSPAMVRGACFDLSYLLIRHRQWHQAALLPELAIDFLNSEYHIPGDISAQMVEAALDVLHSFTPRELDWTSEDYDREFLEHLIVCSLIALDEESLEIDLGFGRNVLSLLKNALALNDETDAFLFAPEITQQLGDIMRVLFKNLEDSPTEMDLYRLKNVLQRDASTPKNKLKPTYLAELSRLMASCWPDGSTQSDLKAQSTSELFQSDLRLLVRNGLLFEEPQSRKPQKTLYHLSNKGYELTCMQFAFTRWAELGTKLHLQSLPSPYQATTLQVLAKESESRLRELIEQEGKYLSPVALRFIIEHMTSHNGENGLLEIFSNLLHNQAHAWIRAEICQALPLSSGLSIEAADLDRLLNDDPSPMVRSAARGVLQRQRLQKGSLEKAEL